MARPKGLCKDCYPDGWEKVPAQFSGVGCEHGSWTRPGEGGKTGEDESGEGVKTDETSAQ